MTTKSKTKSKIRRIPMSVLMRQDPDGFMSEDQLEGALWCFFYRLSRSRDRRGGAQAVGELPPGTRELDQETGEWADVSGQPIMGTAPLNHATGLPESGGDLMPNHRATMGWELALEAIIPPEDFCAACVYTDDLLGLDEEQKKLGVALCFKPKFMAGPNGGPIAQHQCRRCKATWLKEADSRRNRCRNPKCKAEGPGFQYGLPDRRPIVEVRVIDNWSDDEVLAVKNNARTLKRVVHRLAEKGYFNTKPRIDEAANGELGTAELVHGKDGKTIGFSITEPGLEYAQEWARVHDDFTRRAMAQTEPQKLLEAMSCMAELAPEWLKAEARVGAPIRVSNSTAGKPSKKPGGTKK